MIENKKRKIYIIGSIPRTISLETISRYKKAEKELEMYSMEIINPIKNLIDSELSREIAHKKNLSLLLESSYVYLLHESFTVLDKVPELKLAISLNLTIIHQKPVFETQRITGYVTQLPTQ